MCSKFWLLCVTTASLIFAPFAGADEPQKDKEKSSPIIAHIKLSGDLDESPVAESPFGPSGENLRMKLDRIKKAQKDPHVKAMLLELEGLEFGLFSFGKIDELRRYLADFRASGKKIVCYTEDIGGLDYLIACACDEIYIPAAGSFGLVGLQIEMEFYKNALDAIKVKGDFLMMGDAKGAAEPFLRDSMSPENRKQYELVLDDFYENGIIKTIAGSRKAKKWTNESVKRIIDNGPYTAKKAMELGLIDGIMYADALESIVRKSVGNNDLVMTKNYGKAKAQVDDNPLAVLGKLMSPTKKKSSSKPKIAVIYAVGAIESGKGGGGLFGGSSVGSTTMVEAIKQAEKDETVKAIVLRVDSPGGSALASDLIWHELRKSKKPVIASMGDVAASGGYYISMGAKKIYAEPGTLTGSIGVVGGKIVLGGLFDWAGVKTETLTRGKNAGIFSSNTMFSKTERESLTVLMQDIYDQFLDKTLMGRKDAGVKMSKDQLLKIAGGRIWTGRQAKELGLIDELGTLDDALAEAKKLAKLPADMEPELLILPEPMGFLDRFLEGKMDSKLNVNVDGLSMLREMPEMRTKLRTAEMLLRQRNDRVWLMMPCNLRVK